MKLLLLRALGITAAGALVGTLSHAVQFGQALADAPAAACDADGIQFAPEIPPSEAASLCEHNDVVIIDVRSASAFEKGHVAGAVHLPCSGAVLQNSLAGQLTTAETILVYGGNTADARPVAFSLLARSMGAVNIIEGGYTAWEKTGQACTSGPCEHCEKKRTSTPGPQSGDKL